MYLTQGLHRSAQQCPDRLATISGGRSQTFAALKDRVARLAGALRAHGVGTGDRVAYLGYNSDRFHEFYLATFWADAVVNPVNTRWTAPEIVYSLQDSGSRILFIDEIALTRIDEIRAGYDGLDHIIWAGEDEGPAGTISHESLIEMALPIEDARREGEALAGLFYTGGTTGFPKGVMLSHGNLFVSALGSSASRMVHPDAVFLHAAPMFHLADFAAWAIVSLTDGTHVMIPAFSAQAALEAIAAHKVSDTVMVPAMLQQLVDFPELASFDLSSLRHVAYGGSPIAEALLLRAKAALPHVTFCQAYGQTEVAPVATLLLPEDHRIGSPRLRSAGRAAPHTEVGIIREDGSAAQIGEVGEIRVRGGNTMLGYWNKPAESQAVMRDGWIHTGDAGYLNEDGYLFVVDRLKDMIISGGENVYSAEVENCVSQHPAVATCSVIGLPDAKWGERVHALVVLKPGATATADDIKAHAKKWIAGYKCPRTLDFVIELPISSTGKVLKREIRENYLNKINQERENVS